RHPRAARVADFLGPHIGIGKIARHLALCAPEIDLEGERVSPWPAVEHPLQRSVGKDATIPKILAVDLGGGKARWQRAAGHDMRGSDLVGGGVEIDEIAGSYVDSADAQAGAAGVDAIKVDEALERDLQRRYVIEADRVGTVESPRHRRWKPGREEIWGAE